MTENPYASPQALERPRRIPWRALELLIPVAIIAGLIFLPRVYFRAKGTRIAKQHQPIVQAIVNFRAETGLLPYQLGDVETRYEIEIPENVHYSHPGMLYVRDSLTRVSYVFGDDLEGWSSSWGRLSVPAVTPTVEVVTGQRRIDAALAEYDRRIETYENDRWHRSFKMALYASLGREADVHKECVDALRDHPDWWCAQFGAARYAPDPDRDSAETSFRQWADRTPGFVHYWYLAKYYRDLGRDSDALAALAEAAKHPLEQVDDDATKVPHGFAFDAATFACKQEQPELVLAICEAWARPRGVYDYQSPNLPAFRAAAFLALGRFPEARAEASKVIAESQERAIWAGNLHALESAIDRKDRSFVYDPGTPYVGFMEWSPFPRPELSRAAQ